MHVPTGFVNQAQLAQSAIAAIRSLNPQEVVHVAYSIGNDSTDDPAIFFRIVLTDAASREDRLGMLLGVSKARWLIQYAPSSTGA